MGVAASLLAVISLVASALTGCGYVLERFGARSTPPTSAEVLDQSPGADTVVAMARPSVVKVRTVAPRCQKTLDGTGFVVSQNKVLTMAHVVAGGETVTVEFDDAQHDAHVVSFDPKADIAILDVPSLPAPPLGLNTSAAEVGTDVLVLGYPGAGPFAATAAQISELSHIEGPDIYRTGTVGRNVYLISGVAQLQMQGLSGGPVVDMNGQVLGVVLGQNVHDRDIGFVIAAPQLTKHVAGDHTGSVDTGGCVR